jgi:uncharacterized protein YcfJ
MSCLEQSAGASRLIKVTIVAISLSLGACSMNETQERVAGGAALGALVGAALGTSRQSAAIGAAAGAAGGYLYDRHEKGKDADAENERLRRENERLRLQAENQRLREETGQ